MKHAHVAPWPALLAAPFLLAMGFLASPPALERAPEPATRLDALVLDNEGTSTKITHVTYDGALYIPVLRGKALVTIPFEKISHISFGSLRNSTRQITVHFKDHQDETFCIDNRVLFVGRLPFGTYQIQAKDLASVTFLDPHSAPGDQEYPVRGRTDLQ